MSAAFYPWLVNHLWQSTLSAGIAALVVLALRQNNAAVRYRIWFLASLKFLLPFSLFVGLGNQLDWFRPEIPPAAQMTPITVVAGASSPVAPKATSASADLVLPETERGRFPGREVTLNALKGDFEQLNKTGGGDLGGLRAKIHNEIAIAARETIADIVHEPQARDFDRVRGSLQRANNNIQRIAAANIYAQRAQAAVTQAIEDVAAVLIFIKEHPTGGAPAPPAIMPDFSPAQADRGRYPGKETTLNNLKSALDVLAAIPGGDLGGLRAKIQNEIIAAANETLADIRESARRERDEKNAAGVPPPDR